MIFETKIHLNHFMEENNSKKEKTTITEKTKTITRPPWGSNPRPQG